MIDSSVRISPQDCKPVRIAVASRSERLVDSHFGQADSFLIYEAGAAGGKLIERRPIGGEDTQSCTQRRVQLIGDCDAVLAVRVGPHPQALLNERGILCLEYEFTIEKGLRYALHELKCARNNQTTLLPLS